MKRKKENSSAKFILIVFLLFVPILSFGALVLKKQKMSLDSNNVRKLELYFTYKGSDTIYIPYFAECNKYISLDINKDNRDLVYEANGIYEPLPSGGGIPDAIELLDRRCPDSHNGRIQSRFYFVEMSNDRVLKLTFFFKPSHVIPKYIDLYCLPGKVVDRTKKKESDTNNALHVIAYYLSNFSEWKHTYKIKCKKQFRKLPSPLPRASGAAFRQLLPKNLFIEIKADIFAWIRSK